MEQARGTICLRGFDNYDALRALDFLIPDEYASLGTEVWPEARRWARGYNHFYDRYRAPRTNPAGRLSKEAIVSGEELEGATHELDERRHRQEFHGILWERCVTLHRAGRILR